jgi:hypothetical protein
MDLTAVSYFVKNIRQYRPIVTISVNTMDREAPRCRAKPIVLVDLIRESKAKEERREERAEGS